MNTIKIIQKIYQSNGHLKQDRKDYQMEEQSKKQLNQLNETNNISENENKDPFIRFIELKGEDREREHEKFHNFISICEDMIEREKNGETDFIIY